MAEISFLEATSDSIPLITSAQISEFATIPPD